MQQKIYMGLVETPKGTINCEYLIIGPGPWARTFWNMLDLPTRIQVRGQDGTLHPVSHSPFPWS
ncbi:MAG: hypothetical protein U5R49_05525 [Deltaproteobacteria bacterium]|nr:hypothetical protein [Deltaproteobacteria bacterium]